MAKRTKEEVATEIERRKQLFAQAGPAEKRVLVAKDVIEQLDAQLFKAGRQGFLSTTYQWEKELWGAYGDLKNVSLQEELLKTDGTACTVCALGAVFVSCTLFNNQTSLLDGIRDEGPKIGYHLSQDHDFANGMTEVFDKAQLALIEQAFECGRGYYQPGNLGGVAAGASAEYRQLFIVNHAAETFGMAHADSGQRLRAIMNNIIDNGGEFKP